MPSFFLAHLMTTGLGPFYDGLAHLFVTPEDLLPVLRSPSPPACAAPAGGRTALFVLPPAWLAGVFVGRALFSALDLAGRRRRPDRPFRSPRRRRPPALRPRRRRARRGARTLERFLERDRSRCGRAPTGWARASGSRARCSWSWRWSDPRPRRYRPSGRSPHRRSRGRKLDRGRRPLHAGLVAALTQPMRIRYSSASSRGLARRQSAPDLHNTSLVELARRNAPAQRVKVFRWRNL